MRGALTGTDVAEMARRKGNGGTVRDLTVEVLKQIRDEVRQMRTELGARLDAHEKVLVQLVGAVEETNARLDVHEKALGKLIREVESLNKRFDNFLTGAHHEEHDQLKARIVRIETHLGLTQQ